MKHTFLPILAAIFSTGSAGENPRYSKNAGLPASSDTNAKKASEYISHNEKMMKRAAEKREHKKKKHSRAIPNHIIQWKYAACPTCIDSLDPTCETCKGKGLIQISINNDKNQDDNSLG